MPTRVFAADGGSKNKMVRYMLRVHSVRGPSGPWRVDVAADITKRMISPKSTTRLSERVRACELRARVALGLARARRDEMLRFLSSPSSMRALGYGGAAALAAGFAIGTYIAKKPLPAPPTPSMIEAAGGRCVKSPDGRRLVEYFVCGSDRRDALVVVLTGAGGVSGRALAELVQETAFRKNVKVISISLPGWGCGTLHEKLPKWDEIARRDVAAVLDQERVGRFVVAGGSLGAPLAMAVAHVHGPERVLALGVRVPFLPKNASDAAGLETYSKTVSESTYYNALPLGWLFHLLMAPLYTRWTVGLIDPLVQGRSYFECQRDHPAEMQVLYRDMRRAHAHYGHKTRMVLCNPEHVLDWGFDPVGGVRVAKKLLWYAPDDRDVPPSHGRWLAQQWQASAYTPSDVRVRAYEGYGHIGGAVFDWPQYLEELVGLAWTSAPKIAGIVRC